MIGGRHSIEVRSSLGNVYRFQVPRLPAIHRQLLASVVFLYPSEDAARAGCPGGGTGFLITVPDGEVWDFLKHGDTPPQDFPESEERHVYVATAAHVIHQGATVVRINRGQQVEVLPLPVGSDGWCFPADGTDLAVARLGMATPEWQHMAVSHQMFICPIEVLSAGFLNPEGWIGSGDECFLVGRFLTHEGREQNRPSVRFGVMAMSYGEKIRDGSSGLEQESFLVEARSLSGYSGSPVYVYKAAVMGDDGEVRPYVSSRVRLLGVDWCHLSHFEPVLGADRKTPAEPKQWIRLNTGMAGVIPAWKLTELLNDPEVLDVRQEEAGKRERKRLESPGEATLDGAVEAEPSEFDRFEKLTGDLLKVPKSELDEKRKKA